LSQNRKRYWYVRYNCQAGPGASYAAIEGHPLHPEHFKKWSTQTAHQAGLATKFLVQPESVIIDWVYELPEEVARAVFPKDFIQENLGPTS
jgi:hypothetical protein